MAETQFEPMSVGGILDQTFKLYRKHFLRFLAIVAIVQVPLLLIAMAVVAPLAATSVPASEQVRFESSAESEDLGGGSEESDTGPEVSPGVAVAMMVGVLVGVLLMLLGMTLCNAALIKSISESYLGNDVSVGEAYRFILPKVWPIIVAQILVSLFVGCGILLLIVPGIIFIAWYALTTQVIVIEDRGVMGGVKRSKELSKGNRGKILGVIVSVGLLTIIIKYAGGILAMLILAVLPIKSSVVELIVTQGIDIVANVLAAPISAAAMILLYYDLRIRKEGFDLEMLAQSMGAGAQPSYADVPTE
ncbi:MAG: hypothetical protein JXQ73_33780 [Phycisphaerae bacterium]|nr:hypothetical protein [Phycisphaerae bacterium]